MCQVFPLASFRALSMLKQPGAQQHASGFSLTLFIFPRDFVLFSVLSPLSCYHVYLYPHVSLSCHNSSACLSIKPFTAFASICTPLFPDIMNGSLPLRSFHHYYWACNLHKLLYWIIHKTSHSYPPWAHIETYFLQS